MTAESRRRLALAAALLVAGGGLAWVAFGSMGDNLVYFWEPAEVLAAGTQAHGATIRMGGVVEAGSLKWDPEGSDLQFRVTDGEAAVAVHATDAPPQMFREGIGVVVEGRLAKNGTFECDQVMVKHSEEYRAPEEGTDPSTLYKTLEDAQ